MADRGPPFFLFLFFLTVAASTRIRAGRMATTTHGHAATARQQLVRLLLGGGGDSGSGNAVNSGADHSAQTLSRAQLETALRAVDTRLEAKQNALRELITGGGNDAMNAATDTSTTTATNAATPSIHRFQHFLHATRDKNARAQRLLDARKLLDERRTDMDALAMDVTSMERLFAKRQRMLAVRRVCRRVVKALRRGREAARMLDDEAEHASVSNVAVATAAMGTGAQVDATWHHSPAQALSHVEAWRTLRDALAEVEEQVDAHRASETTQDSSAIISNKRHSVASLSGERALRSASFSSTNQLHHSATASSSFWTVAQAQVVRRLHNRERAFRATLTGRLVDALNALTRRRHGNRDAEADAAATSTIDIQFLADMERLCNALFTFDGALDAWMQAFVKRFGTEVVAAVVLGSIKSVQVERVGNDGLFLRLVANNVDARGKESDVVDDNERGRSWYARGVSFHIIELFAFATTAIRLHNAASALDFLHQLIPAPHRQLLQKLVNTVVFPDITAKVINNLLMPALPARFEDLPRVADQLRVALAPLLACQLVAGADIATVAKPLNEFVANLENLFADSRCESLLLQARDVLMKEDFANVLIMEVAEEGTDGEGRADVMKT